jgi:NADP-dependent 3-hydroxy acid dehydrogenase YdfG
MTRRSTVVITGAGGALAAAVIARFAELGWRTALFDVADVEPLRERHPEALVYSVDLSDEEATQRVMASAANELDGIDALVNLAGGFAMRKAAEATLGDLHAMLGINLVTAVNATTAALPGMLARGHGTVVGIAAGQAIDGGARAAAYAASKAAVAAYLRSVDRELAVRGVSTVVVYPMGTLDTKANRQAMPDADPGGWIATDTLAHAITSALALGPRGRVRKLKVYPEPRG